MNSLHYLYVKFGYDQEITVEDNQPYDHVISCHYLSNSLILDGLEGDTRIYCPRC